MPLRNRYFRNNDDCAVVEIIFPDLLPDSFISKLQIRLRHHTLLGRGGSWRYGCCLSVDQLDLLDAPIHSPLPAGSVDSSLKRSICSNSTAQPFGFWDEIHSLSGNSVSTLTRSNSIGSSKDSKSSSGRRKSRGSNSSSEVVSYAVLLQHSHSIYILSSKSSTGPHKTFKHALIYYKNKEKSLNSVFLFFPCTKAMQAIVCNELAQLCPGNRRSSPWSKVVLHFGCGTYRKKNLLQLFPNKLLKVSKSSPNLLSTPSRVFIATTPVDREFDEFKAELLSQISKSCMEKIFGLKWVIRSIFL